jgi:hypothetical protein
MCSVVDQHRCDADPDPTFDYDADPDPDPTPSRVADPASSKLVLDLDEINHYFWKFWA